MTGTPMNVKGGSTSFSLPLGDSPVVRGLHRKPEVGVGTSEGVGATGSPGVCVVEERWVSEVGTIGRQVSAEVEASSRISDEGGFSDGTTDLTLTISTKERR